MWRRGRNGANPGMVPPWGRGSSSRGRTHGRNILSSGSGSYMSRHGGGCSGGHGDDDNKAWVGASGRGRRRVPHYGPEAVSFTRLHHGCVGEGGEKERMGGREVSEMIWNEKQRKGRGGGGGVK